MIPIQILEETTDVLNQVEERSGTPVEITTDPSLPTYARIKIARGSATHHILTYNPTKPGVDYHIAYQCGFVLRLFENPGGGDTSLLELSLGMKLRKSRLPSRVA